MKKHPSKDDPCKCHCYMTLAPAYLKKVAVYRDEKGRTRCSRCMCEVTVEA